jgi:hypothetical protein
LKSAYLTKQVLTASMKVMNVLSALVWEYPRSPSVSSKGDFLADREWHCCLNVATEL